MMAFESPIEAGGELMSGFEPLSWMVVIPALAAAALKDAKKPPLVRAVTYGNMISNT